jgi:hypothetical protein
LKKSLDSVTLVSIRYFSDFFIDKFGAVKMRNILLLSVCILTLFSFNAFAEAGSSKQTVKKYFIGKPGYNRRVRSVYKRDVVDEINYQLAVNAPATGSQMPNKNKHKLKYSYRKRAMGLRRHP